MPKFRTILATLVLLAALVIPVELRTAEPPISLRVTPQVGFEPLGVNLNIRVPHHPDNRMICAVIEDVFQASYRRSSCWDHMENGPLQTIENKLGRGLMAVEPLETFNYEVRVVLTRVSPRGDISESMAKMNIRVLTYMQ